MATDIDAITMEKLLSTLLSLADRANGLAAKTHDLVRSENTDIAEPAGAVRAAAYACGRLLSYCLGQFGLNPQLIAALAQHQVALQPIIGRIMMGRAVFSEHLAEAHGENPAVFLKGRPEAIEEVFIPLISDMLQAAETRLSAIAA